MRRRGPSSFSRAIRMRSTREGTRREGTEERGSGPASSSSRGNIFSLLLLPRNSSSNRSASSRTILGSALSNARPTPSRSRRYKSLPPRPSLSTQTGHLLLLHRVLSPPTRLNTSPTPLRRLTLLPIPRPSTRLTLPRPPPTPVSSPSPLPPSRPAAEDRTTHHRPPRRRIEEGTL